VREGNRLRSARKRAEYVFVVEFSWGRPHALAELLAAIWQAVRLGIARVHMVVTGINLE
jgi:hypothetical protein